MMENKLMAVDEFGGRIFGVLPDGRRVDVYEISNQHGVEMSVITFGAVINSLRIPSKVGLIDVVLGFDTIGDYIESQTLPAPPYFGAVIGRYSGRIKDGTFNLHHKTIRLNVNNNGNTLHGGINGFDRVLWTVQSLKSNSISLRYVSADGEEGFPGTMTVLVTYTITDDNQINIDYEATSDADTVVNLTQHSYFNLDGHKGDLRIQDLMINSSRLLEIDSNNIPSGNIVEASTKGMDFSGGGKSPFFGIDDSFIISDPMQPAAILSSKSSGLQLIVKSDQPSLHIYVGGNCFGKINGKHGADYHQHSGICFESQNYPDAPNQFGFPSAYLPKGEIYRQHTSWKFEMSAE